jgi:serine/threonine-protein kinase
MQSDIPSETNPSVAAGESSASEDVSASELPGSTPPSGRVVVAFNDAPAFAPDDKTVITQRPSAVDAPAPILSAYQHIGDTLIGKQLDHYELIELVGGGGMGAVFRANDTRLGRTVAVMLRNQSDEGIAGFATKLARPTRSSQQRPGLFPGGRTAGIHRFEFIEGVNLRDRR